MRRHDLTNKKTMTMKMTKTKTNTMTVIHSDPKVPEFWKTVDSHFPDPRESSMHIKSHEWPVLLERVSSVLEGVKDGEKVNQVRICSNLNLPATFLFLFRHLNEPLMCR